MNMDFLAHLNYLAIIVCMIVSTLIGWLWYGPLFGKAWAKGMNMNMEMTPEKKKAAMRGYIWTLITSLITAFALAVIIHHLGIGTVRGAIMTGLTISIGFLATSIISSSAFEQKPMTVVAINVFYQIVNLIVLSLILTLWR